MPVRGPSPRAARRCRVTLTSDVHRAGRPRSTPSPTMAAWWHTASTPASAASTAAGSRTSPTTRSGANVRGRPLCTAGVSESRPRTSWPAARMVSAMCDPMNPAAPVTSTRMHCSQPAARTGQDRPRQHRHTFVRPDQPFSRSIAGPRKYCLSPWKSMSSCRASTRQAPCPGCCPGCRTDSGPSSRTTVPPTIRPLSPRRTGRAWCTSAAWLRRRVPRRAARGDQRHRLRDGRRRLLRPR